MANKYVFNCGDEGGHHKRAELLTEEREEHLAFLLSRTRWTSVDSRIAVRTRSADLRTCSMDLKKVTA